MRSYEVKHRSRTVVHFEPPDNNLARVDQECFKSVPSDPPVPPLFFGVWSRAHARALRAGALFCGGVPVSVHGGPYSFRSEAFEHTAKGGERGKGMEEALGGP